jgi:hypothetical protein
VAAALFCLRITVVSATARTCVNGLTGVPDRLWRLPADVGGAASVIKRALLTAAVVCQQLCWISAGAVARNAVKHVCGHQHAYGASPFPNPTCLSWCSILGEVAHFLWLGFRGIVMLVCK